MTSRIKLTPFRRSISPRELLYLKHVAHLWRLANPTDPYAYQVMLAELCHDCCSQGLASEVKEKAEALIKASDAVKAQRAAALDAERKAL